MDDKTTSGFSCSRTSSRNTGRSSSLQDLNNRRSTVVRVTEKIAKSKDLVAASSMDNKILCQNTLRLVSCSVDHQKSLSSQGNQSLPQKSSTMTRINETMKTTLPKCSRKQLEASEEKTTSITGLFHELPSFTEYSGSATHRHLEQDRKQIRSRSGCGSLRAPTISFTQRLIASRDAKETAKKSSHGAGAETKNCKLNDTGSSNSKNIPSVRSQSISVPNRRDSMSITNRKLSGSLNTRTSTSNSSNDSRIIGKPKINIHSGMLKPQKHSKRGTSTGLQPRGNPIPLPSEFVVSSKRFSKSLDTDSFSRRKDFVRHNTSSRPTSSPGQGGILSLYHCSANSVAHSLNYHDQHREMRMNIDNMSYEELLELQEKIGSVNTGLTDEVLRNCLKISNFKLAPSPSGITEFFDSNGCSICQEECDDGEDIGTLACEHWYHVVCIKQWLRLKNWCPICKSPASVGS